MLLCRTFLEHFCIEMAAVACSSAAALAAALASTSLPTACWSTLSCCCACRSKDVHSVDASVCLSIFACGQCSSRRMHAKPQAEIAKAEGEQKRQVARRSNLYGEQKRQVDNRCKASPTAEGLRLTAAHNHRY